ncbi:MAG: hypothetical protein KY475_14230 [Planctomycetes bacterium]|nr:hypothetical protein [Planctomycetota bacterium]
MLFGWLPCTTAAPPASEKSQVNRTWTDQTGNYQIEATLVETQADAVVLKKLDGKTVTVPISRLSGDDQKFLRELTAAETGAGESRAALAEDAEPGTGASRRSRKRNQRKTPADVETEMAALEKVLFDLPGTPQEEVAWLTAWRQRLRLGFQISGTSTIGIGIKNGTPSKIRVLKTLGSNQDALGHLRVFQGTRPAPQHDWSVERGKELTLATAPRIPLIPVQQNVQGRLVVSMHYRVLCRLEVAPTHEKAEPLALSVLLRYGDNGQVVTCADYFLCLSANEEAAMDALLKQ